jgi:hypothetical protein
MGAGSGAGGPGARVRGLADDRGGIGSFQVLEFLEGAVVVALDGIP